MAKPRSKEALRDELIAIVSSDLATVERAQRDATVGATHEEAKPENDKDTRALEASYLARGQASRVEELRAALAELQRMPVRAFRADEPIALGALVEVLLDEKPSSRMTILLAAHGGGSRLSNGAVQVVTPKSPLGAAVLGKRARDDAEATLGGRLRTLEIVSVS